MQLSFASVWIWSCALAAAVSLAHGETLPESLKRCALERDKDVRLACYDEVAAIAAGRPEAAPPPTPEQQFGVTPGLLRKQQAEGSQTPELERLVAKVTKIRTLSRGHMLMNLDNGQVWQQKEPRAFLLKVGEQVTIEPGSLGSFWLANEDGRRTKVTRVR
jgi:hypothetical protein